MQSSRSIRALRWVVLAMCLLITIWLEPPSTMQAGDKRTALNAHESVFALLAAEDPAALDAMRAPPLYHSVGHVRHLEPCDVEEAECWARLVEGASVPPRVLARCGLNLTRISPSFLS
jgi:hypothetical protein